MVVRPALGKGFSCIGLSDPIRRGMSQLVKVFAVWMSHNSNNYKITLIMEI
jgi:hypothetical protein